MDPKESGGPLQKERITMKELRRKRAVATASHIGEEVIAHK